MLAVYVEVPELYPPLLVVTTNFPPVTATDSNTASPEVENARLASPLPFEPELIFNEIFILGLGAVILGATGSTTTLGSNDGNPAIVTFFLIFGFTFDIDFGVIDALIGISAFGS